MSSAADDAPPITVRAAAPSTLEYQTGHPSNFPLGSPLSTRSTR